MTRPSSDRDRPGDEAARGGDGARRKAIASRLFAYGVAAVALFSVLAKSGIWDPYELDAADLARRIAIQVFGARGLELPGAQSSLPTLTDLEMGELPFTSMALGFRLFGLHDWAGRLPLAAWAFAGVVATYEFMARFVDRRAGLYAALALVTMPLYFMQARTMLGDIVTMVALAFAFFGLVGAMLDRGALRFGWFALGLVGLGAGFMSRGLLLGVAAPAFAAGASWLVIRGAGERRDVSLFDAFGGVALVMGLVAFGHGLAALVHAREGAPLVRAVGFAILKRAPTEATFDLIVRQLGHALFPWSAFLPFAIGRSMRPPMVSDREAEARETAVRVALLVGAAVTYGAYAFVAPKSGVLAFSGPAILAAIAAVAVLDFERGAPPSRVLSMGCVVLGLVLYADMVHVPERALSVFVVDKPQFPKSFEEESARRLFAVLVAFAALSALVWFDAPERARRETSQGGVWSAVVAWWREKAELSRRLFEDLAALWSGNLLFGLVVVEAALIGLGAMIFIGRRAHWVPVERLPKNFADLGLNVWWIAPLTIAIAPLAWLAVRDGFESLVARSRAPRASFTLAAALLSGGGLGYWYYPDLSAQLSPKEAFEAYESLRTKGEPLSLLGVRARAAAYYAGGEVGSFSDVGQAFSWLSESMDARRWMVVRADDLPRLNALYRARFERNLPVLDGRSSQILLASNQLGGRANESWISKIVLDEPPAPARPLDIWFEDQLHAIGWEVTDAKGVKVESVVPGRTYHLRFYLRVEQPIPANWKAFVHIDGFQRRFNGDHAVLGGRYAMNLWQVGDVVVDELPFQLEPNFTPGDYTVYFGFFSGDTRLRVASGPNHENRAIAGALTVR